MIRSVAPDTAGAVRSATGRLLSVLLLSIAGLLAACDNLPPVPDGRIEFRNLLSGSEHTTIYVNSQPVKSGQGLLLPPGATFFSVSYDDGKRVRAYSVQCPSNIGSGVRIRLIDLYQNRLPGGCTRSASE